ncbi:serine protease [Pilimelia terevasa]|uniref:Serine protease n=1 Tax=Pilimelia terevasa TaxID=53372 RepID=A0A8J3FM23_9ACTN|nr:S1 family peptidase [Pilimelia terevasa]GGK42237.1 serine protease [Pilimelia terevasa]
MTRRLVFAAVTVPVLAVGAFAVPAVADALWPGAAPPPPDPYTSMLAAMQRDLALTPDQTRDRLAAERRAAAAEATLRDRLGRRYGGAWLSPDARTLTVGVTDRAEEAQVRALGAQPRLVRHSAAALRDVQARLDRSAARAPVAGWYVDVAENAVVVLADGSAPRARAFLRRSGVPEDAVRVRARPERPRLYAAAPRGGEGFRGPAGRCSIGFAVEGGFVTAGHCGRPGQPTRTGADRPLGVFASADFPRTDYAFVRTDDPVAAVVNDHRGGTVPVQGAREAPVGASVCRSGTATGWRCGTITARGATVRYKEGSVAGLTRTDVCAEPGDSGGSWVSDGQAQGVTSGGSGDCAEGGVTYFQPLRDALQAYGLNLRVDDPPRADAGGCADAPTRGAAVLRADAPSYRPNATYYVADAPRRHAGCVSAAGGTPVRLALERWTGRTWVTEATAGGTGTATLRHDGPAGYYRYRAQTTGEPVAATIGYAPPR